MAIVKMKRLQVLALERDHDAILRRLQHMGCLEISEPDVQALPDTLRRCDTAAADLLARQRQLQSAIDILRRTAPPQKTGLLTPRPRISEREYLDEAALASELETAQHINELAADVNRLTARETQLRSEQAALTPWRSLDIPLELTETRWCDITTGTLPPFAVWEEIQGTLSQQVPESEAYLLYADRQQQGILLLTHKAVTAQALELLRSFGFSGGQLKGRHGTPEENLTALADSLRQTAAEKDAALQELAGLGGKLPDMQLCSDRLNSRLMREENRKRLMTDGCIVAFDGWVPAEKLPAADGVAGHAGLCLRPQRPHAGGDPRRAGGAEGQHPDPLHELHHGAVLHARLRRRGPQPRDGAVLHLLLWHDDGGHGLRSADDRRLPAVPEEKAAR